MRLKKYSWLPLLPFFIFTGYFLLWPILGVTDPNQYLLKYNPLLVFLNIKKLAIKTLVRVIINWINIWSYLIYFWLYTEKTAIMIPKIQNKRLYFSFLLIIINHINCFSLNLPTLITGQEGLEPPTYGFGDRYSANWATDLYNTFKPPSSMLISYCLI